MNAAGTTFAHSVLRLPPQQYASQNIELLSNNFCKAAKELWSAGQYDHSLTLTMIKAFLKCSVQGIFAYVLNGLLIAMHSAISVVAFMTKIDANRHIVKEKLGYRQVCQVATDLYRTAFDDNEWGPHRPPSGFSLTQGRFSKEEDQEAICWLLNGSLSHIG